MGSISYKLMEKLKKRELKKLGRMVEPIFQTERAQDMLDHSHPAKTREEKVLKSAARTLIKAGDKGVILDDQEAIGRTERSMAKGRAKSPAEITTRAREKQQRRARIRKGGLRSVKMPGVGALGLIGTIQDVQRMHQTLQKKAHERKYKGGKI